MTSVELPSALLREARIYAARHGVTLRQLLEQGLRVRLRQKEDAMTGRTTPREETP